MLIDNLIARARIVRTIRSFFDDLGFAEVETAVRIAAPAPEPHIDCPLAPLTSQTSQTFFLRASPELQMKKLLAYGMDKIYQIGPCFREGECGSRHNPEFSMLEWYRKNATYLDIADDMEKMLGKLRSLEVEKLRSTVGNQSANCQLPTTSCQLPTTSCQLPTTSYQLPTTNFSRLTVREAYRKLAGWDPWTAWDQDRFDFDMAEKIEPNLPEGPVFLMDYPPQACSLAKLRMEADGAVAERWELYWQGIELANCFTELCDGDEQRRRFVAARDERRALGESDYPLDEEFLNLLPLIGSAAGVALGVDRLVMLLCGEKTIASVMGR